MYINFFLNVGPHKVGGPIQMFRKTTLKPGSAKMGRRYRT